MPSDLPSRQRRRAAIYETVIFVVFAIAGFYSVVLGAVSEDRSWIALGIGLLAFAKASRAMAWHHEPEGGAVDA